jgi:hypothetical protein
MDFNATPTRPASTAGSTWILAALAAAAALAYGCILFQHAGAVAGGADSSGYLNGARLLASGRTHVAAKTLAGLPPEGEDAYLYTPLGFRPSPSGGLVPTYPAGFPLLILAALPIAGWAHAADLVLVLHAVAGVALTFALGRLLGLGRPWAFLCAALVALSPLYLYMSLQAMSDVPSLAWCAFAVVAALRSRVAPRFVYLAGLALSVAVLLRPTNVIVFLPAAAALGADPRRWLRVGIAGVPGAAFLLVHNSLAYGSFLTTGYGDFSTFFSASFVLPTLAHYALWLPRLFTPVVVLSAALPFVSSLPARTRWVLVSWIAGFGGFYATYYCTQETWWYLRFLLPAAPALVVGAVLVLRGLTDLSPKAGPLLSASAFVAALGLAAADLAQGAISMNVMDVGRTEQRYTRVAEWMRANLPPDAICLCMQESGAVEYYTDLAVLRWDWIKDRNRAAVLEAVRRSGRPVYAVLFAFESEKTHLLSEQMPGPWSEIWHKDDVTVYRRSTGAAYP